MCALNIDHLAQVGYPYGEVVEGEKDSFSHSYLVAFVVPVLEIDFHFYWTLCVVEIAELLQVGDAKASVLVCHPKKCLSSDEHGQELVDLVHFG